MSRTLRIPVYRQPPVWLIACVVVASLSPLAMRAVGIEPGPDLAAAVSTAKAQEPAIQAPEPAPPLLPHTKAVASVEAATAQANDAPDDLDVVVFDDLVEDDEGDIEADELELAEAETDIVTEPSRAPVARSHEDAAKAACRRGNKEAARSMYRDLPRGDARRKEIRRACRQEGVWLL